jgi:SnoaL-like domain
MPNSDTHLESARTYFSELDSGRIPEELFAPDFEFYFPKFGVGQGFEELGEFAVGLMGAGLKVTHHRDRLTYLTSGSKVVVEGTTYGENGAGGGWDGGATPGGRFCSVFDFNDAGLIQRMYVYMDPDYTSADHDRMRWNRAHPRW